MAPLQRLQLTDGMRIDYPPFDAMHANLIDHLNAIGDTHDGKTENVGVFVHAFLDHMAKEVDILNRLAYPLLDEHATNHQALREKALSLLAQHRNQPISAAAAKELLWILLEDALKDDMKAKEFLGGQPVIAP